MDERRHPRDREQITLWRVPDVEGLEAMRASLVSHAFCRHSHDTLTISVVDAGQGAFWCEGTTHYCGRDSLVLIGAGQIHTGRLAAGSVLRYRTLYPNDALIRSLLGVRVGHVRVTCHAPHDYLIAAAIRHLHADLSRPSARIERETALLEVLELLLGRYLHCGDGAGEGREPRAVQQAREYLDGHLVENISLRTLAGLVGLSPAYLNRVFRQTVGLPPHAYLTQRRVARAKALLAAGTPPSAVAQQVGFADQSHLTRHFRRAFGVTPGSYRVRVGSAAA